MRKSEVAEILGRHIRTVDRLIERGHLAALQLGGTCYIERDELVRALKDAKRDYSAGRAVS